MRVFDFYQFNIAEHVSYKDTVAYLQNMLSELGLGYKNLSFNIDLIMRKEISDIIADYPHLERYKYFYNRYRRDILTSMTPEWGQGKIYVEKDDKDSVLDIFSKAARVYNFVGTMILQQIDWFGDGIKPTAFNQTWDIGEPTICGSNGIVNNSIILTRSFGYGNKTNIIGLLIESTTDGEPRDTGELLLRLEPYLGKPIFSRRDCYFEPKESELFETYRKEARDILRQKISEIDSKDKEKYRTHVNDTFVPALIDKKMIRDVFRDTDFTVLPKRKGDLPGMNSLTCVDRHNFKYTLDIDRSSLCPTFFYFYICITGCNFVLSSDQEVIMAADRKEAAEKLSYLAKFVTGLKNEFGGYLAERFGDTPGWYFVEKD